VNGSIRSDQSPDFYSCVAKKSRGFSDKKREEKGRLGLVIWIVLHRKGSVCSLWESFKFPRNLFPPILQNPSTRFLQPALEID